jgi:hypothetical protein
MHVELIVVGEALPALAVGFGLGCAFPRRRPLSLLRRHCGTLAQASSSR